MGLFSFWRRYCDMSCINGHIDHRLTAPATPKTNGMVERVNGTIKNATIKVLTYKDETELKPI